MNFKDDLFLLLLSFGFTDLFSLIVLLSLETTTLNDVSIFFSSFSFLFAFVFGLSDLGRFADLDLLADFGLEASNNSF